jgi:hypothetical protein
MAVGTAGVRELMLGTFSDIEAIAASTATRQKLLHEMRQVEASLAKRLLDEAAKAGGPSTRFTTAQAEAYQHHVQLAASYLEERVKGLTAAQARKAIGTSLTKTVKLMEGLEKRFSGVTPTLQLRQAAQLRIASSKAQGLWARDFPTSVDRYGAKMMGEFEEIIRQGIVQGMTHEDMVAALTGHGGPKGTVSMAAKVGPGGVVRLVESEIPEGLFVRHKYWADRIVRTETLRAYNGARHVGFQEMQGDFPDLQKKIVAILDKRTAPDSIAVNGQVRPIDGLFMDGAGRQYLYPPARPNDRETTLPWRPEWDAPAAAASETERALLGELTPEEEDALVAKYQGSKPAPTPKPKVLPPPPPPKPAPPPVVFAPTPTAASVTHPAVAPENQVSAPSPMQVKIAKAKAALEAYEAKKDVAKAKEAALAAAKKRLEEAQARKAKADAERAAAAKPKPLEQHVKLPPPPPYQYTEAERAAYKKEAMAEIRESRVEWNYSGKQSQDDSVKPGLTYSRREFTAIRSRYAKALAADELDACLYYSHQGDQVLNSSCRYGMLHHEPDVAAMAETLDRAIQRHAMPKDVYVARGMSGPWAKQVGNLLRPGDTFVEPAYCSTSATTPFGGEMKMRIKIPKGAAAAPIPTRYSDEDEFLLPRGTKFKVVKNTRLVDKYGHENFEIEVEVMP